MLVTFGIGLVGFANEPMIEAGCNLNHIEGPALTAAWTTAEPDLALAVQGDRAPGAVMVEARAWFGGLEYSWTTGPHRIAADECDTVQFAVPPEAFLHQLATQYVTDLLVRVVPVDERGNRLQETALPVAYAIWPHGPSEAPEIWDRNGLAANAPYGVLDPEGLFEPSPGISSDGLRYLPPIAQELNLARTNSADERTDHVTTQSEVE